MKKPWEKIMRMLELKVPPLLLMILFMLVMWVLSAFSQPLDMSLQSSLVLSGFFVFAGCVFSLAGVYSFRKAKTTVDPTRPQAVSALVTSGVYRLSRNPMYVGFLFFLLAWGIYLANLFSLLLAGGFVLYMNYFQIQPEERILYDRFGEQFERYVQQVRRWL